jgi:DNA invertase Pin-like site-specific DNA recombinase
LETLPILYWWRRREKTDPSQSGGKMFNHFYVKQEQYRDLIKEAEKERIIKGIKEGQKQIVEASPQKNEQGDLVEKLALIFREARLSASK